LIASFQNTFVYCLVPSSANFKVGWKSKPALSRPNVLIPSMLSVTFCYTLLNNELAVKLKTSKSYANGIAQRKLPFEKHIYESPMQCASKLNQLSASA